MSLKQIISEAGIKQIQNQGEQFMRYWKTVSEDLRTLTEAMVINFEKTNTQMEKLIIELESMKNEINRKHKKNR